MRLAVTDANIFIDLFEIKLIELLFRIGHEIHTTDRVLLELYLEQQQSLEEFVAGNQLTIHVMTDEDNNAIAAKTYNAGLSDADRSVLWIAEKSDAIVLTGDDLVRKNCHQAKIEIHGILWLLDQFVDGNHLAAEKAAHHLRDLIGINHRLPIHHCNERLVKWAKA